ncbi:hypothetical protein LFZ30_05350 [Salmonella enterica subsp. enterica serovar Moscow str. SA20061414]|nr:hypothetical protein LFZ30_05350 [Salmonella enterica subsp. enterica serovar Moscow str. SA20061414]
MLTQAERKKTEAFYASAIEGLLEKKMCFTSKNCYKTGNFSCVLKQKDPDFLKRFSAIWFF